MGEKKTKNVVIIALCLTLIFMGVGFAILSQNLQINSTGTISSTWDVHFDSFNDNTSVITATNADNEGKSMSATLDADKHVATVNFSLTKPGDSVQYKGVIKNYGNIKALLSTYTNSITKPDGGYSQYVTRTLTINGTTVTADASQKVTAPANLVLSQNQTAEVLLTYTFKENVTDLPEFNTDTNNDSKNDAYVFAETFTFGFVQK